MLRLIGLPTACVLYGAWSALQLAQSAAKAVAERC